MILTEIWFFLLSLNNIYLNDNIMYTYNNTMRTQGYAKKGLTHFTSYSCY